ncbi:MAG: hypothetical protein IBX52_06725 [Bacterioplanes sp.]|nr:hypothetical protein [Bacterioplanes sp.]
MNHHFLFHLSVLILLLSVTACTSTPKTNPDIFNEISRATEVSYENDAEKALAEAEATFRQAQSETLDFFSPRTYLRIESEVKEARQANVEGDTGRIQIASQQASILLQDGLRTKQNVTERLQQPLAHKQALDQIKAANVSRDSYRDIMHSLQQQIARIEQGEGVTTAEIDSLLERMQWLEIHTVLTVHWQPAERALAQAKSEKAQRFAPKTFQQASVIVNSAEKAIREQYQDIEVVTQLGQAALRGAQQALFIARESRLLENATPSSAEAFVLRIQNYLFDIAQTLDGMDVRHLSLQDQSLAIQQRLEERLQPNR